MRVHFSKTYLKRCLTVVIIVSLVAAFCVWRWSSSDDSASRTAYIPESINKELRFAPYVPSWLPNGYSVDVASYSVEGQALIFSAVSARNKEKVVFSEQAIPKDFDMNSFYDNMMKETTRLENTPYATVLGEARNGGQKVASMIAGDTWVIMTLPKDSSDNDVRQLAAGMVRQ